MKIGYPEMKFEQSLAARPFSASHFLYMLAYYSLFPV